MILIGCSNTFHYYSQTLVFEQNLNEYFHSSEFMVMQKVNMNQDEQK